MTEVKAKFLRMAGGYGFPVARVTYVFKTEDQGELSFTMNHFLEGNTPDGNTEGVLKYDGDQVISFSYGTQVWQNKKIK